MIVWLDRLADGQMNGRTDGRICGRKVGCMNEMKRWIAEQLSLASVSLYQVGYKKVLLESVHILKFSTDDFHGYGRCQFRFIAGNSR